MQELLHYLKDGHFLDSLTAGVSLQLMTYNAALEMFGFFSLTLAVSPWGTYTGELVFDELPIRMYSWTTRGVLKSLYDALFLAAALLFAHKVWEPFAPRLRRAARALWHRLRSGLHRRVRLGPGSARAGTEGCHKGCGFRNSALTPNSYLQPQATHKPHISHTWHIC